jgi:hypothetical protein
MQTRGYEEEKLQCTLKSAINIALTKNLNLSANAKYSKSTTQNNLAASTSISYKFLTKAD